jgi:hypothetical protein
MWWLLLLLAAFGPERYEIEPWLGRYVAGPETIAFRFAEDGLVYDHGNISIRVDGEWPPSTLVACTFQGSRKRGLRI